MSYDKKAFKIISIIVVLTLLYILFGCKNKQVQCEAYSVIDKNTVFLDSLYNYDE